VRSTIGGTCRIRVGGPIRVSASGRAVDVGHPHSDVAAFETVAGAEYVIRP